MADYRPDHRGMRQLAQSAGMSNAMQQAAETGRRWAEAEAPRGRTGVYADSFRVKPATVPGGRLPREDRAGAVLYNDAPHAGEVEWGLGYGILGRSVNIIEGQR